MPTYCFRDRHGRLVEKELRLADLEAARVDGDKFRFGRQVLEHDFAAEAGVSRGDPWGSPLASRALGCHPSQIGEMQAFLASRGVRADFTPDGKCLLESRGHRNQVLEARGYRDLDAGYGDVSPR